MNLWNQLYLTYRILLGLIFACITATAVHAGIPVWSFTPNESPVVVVSPTGTATISYTITNNSQKPHQLALYNSPAGITQLGGPCLLAAKSAANPKPTCTFTLNINGSALRSNNIAGGPVLCQTNSNGTPNPNQCYQPAQEDALVVTRATTSGATTLDIIETSAMLALSVNNPLQPALTGNPRQISIKNTGTASATGINIVYPTWPAGTTASSTCTDTLAVGDTCVITVTPGAESTSNCATGIAPTPGTIVVSAANVSATLPIQVVVLSYGCKYQRGFLYSVDDTTNDSVSGMCISPPCEGSIGGKVVALGNQASPYPNGVVWTSNGGTGNGSGGYNPIDASNDILPGIDDQSTTLAGSPTYTTPAGPSGSVFTTFFSDTYNNANPFTNASFSSCNGRSDGACNTANIVAFYNRFITNNTEADGGAPKFTASNGSTILSYYAAGRCAAYEVDSVGNTPCSTGTCYTNWYLPAICEMGPDSGESICDVVNVEQNMVDNLPFLLGASCGTPSECLEGFIWSSTEYSEEPSIGAWQQHFDLGDSFQGTGLKADQHGVRCARALSF